MQPADILDRMGLVVNELKRYPIDSELAALPYWLELRGAGNCWRDMI